MAPYRCSQIKGCDRTGRLRESKQRRTKTETKPNLDLLMRVSHRWETKQAAETNSVASSASRTGSEVLKLKAEKRKVWTLQPTNREQGKRCAGKSIRTADSKTLLHERRNPQYKRLTNEGRETEKPNPLQGCELPLAFCTWTDRGQVSRNWARR
jgi:hypothetical protein